MDGVYRNATQLQIDWDGIYYATQWYLMQIESGNQRNVFGSLTYGSGGFFAGDRLTLRGSLGWRPSKHFLTRISYQFDDIDLPEGQFTTRVLSFRLDTVLSAKVSWVNLLQYDNVTELASLNSRLH